MTRARSGLRASLCRKSSCITRRSWTKAASARDLRQRLHDQIARARQLYEEKVSPAIRRHADYFEQELVRTLADGDPVLLGQRS